MKTITKYLAAATFCLSLIVVSCKSEKEPEPGEVAVLSIDKSNEEPEIYELTIPQTLSVDLKVVADPVSDNTLNISFKVDPDRVNDFNEANKTDCLLLPATSYDVENMEVILPKFNKISSTANILVESQELEYETSYVLPVVIGEVKGNDNWEKDEKGSVYYIQIKTLEKPEQKDPVKIDRTGWKILYCTSQLEENYGGSIGMSGLAEDMLDGDEGTVWGYNWEKKDLAPYHFVFDMGEEVSVNSLGLIARMKNGKVTSAPRNITIQLAAAISDPEGMNDSDYTYKESFKEIKEQQKTEISLKEVHKARYIKFTIDRSWGATVEGDGTRGGNLAEFYIIGTSASH